MNTILRIILIIGCCIVSTLTGCNVIGGGSSEEAPWAILLAALASRPSSSGGQTATLTLGTVAFPAVYSNDTTIAWSSDTAANYAVKINASSCTGGTASTGTNNGSNFTINMPANIQIGSRILNSQLAAGSNTIYLCQLVSSTYVSITTTIQKLASGADYETDGVANQLDNCPSVSNPTQLDTDGDTVGDSCDNCSFTTNITQQNTDGDSQGDICDTDDDNDSIADISDNCSLLANTNQANFDGDALGDECDSDDDNDGFVDTADACPFNAACH